MKDKIQSLNWDSIAQNLNTKGYTTIPSLLSNEQCESLRALYQKKREKRKRLKRKRRKRKPRPKRKKRLKNRKPKRILKRRKSS